MIHFKRLPEDIMKKIDSLGECLSEDNNINICLSFWGTGLCKTLPAA